MVEEKSFSKTTLMSLYIGLIVLGVSLMLAAIYSASKELELVYEVNDIHRFYSDRSAKISGQTTLSELQQLAQDLSTEHYTTYLVSSNSFPDVELNCGLALTHKQLEESRINHKGGHIASDACDYIWALVEMPGTSVQLLVVHAYQFEVLGQMLKVYGNSLIVPMVFFIWLSVWGSLMLGNLFKRLQRQKDELEHMALHDLLSDLPNRHLFSRELDAVLSYSERNQLTFALGVIDLNKFKEVNDSFGHACGDEIIRLVADRMKETIREYDVAARIGGDEFVVFLPDADRATSVQVFERVHTALIKPYVVDGYEIEMSVSIGLAFYPEHAINEVDLIHRADIAMYMVKKQGGGIMVYNQT